MASFNSFMTEYLIKSCPELQQVINKGAEKGLSRYESIRRANEEMQKNFKKEKKVKKVVIYDSDSDDDIVLVIKKKKVSKKMKKRK